MVHHTGQDRTGQDRTGQDRTGVPQLLDIPPILGKTLSQILTKRLPSLEVLCNG